MLAFLAKPFAKNDYRNDLALALAPVAHALGVTKPDDDPCCPAFFDPFLTIDVPNGQCGDQLQVPCAGYYTCEIPEWTFIEALPSCDSRENCELAGGEYKEAVLPACCGTCDFS